MRTLLFAVLLASFLSPTLTRAASFSDVPEGHPASEAIGALVEWGILTGYGDGTFRPDQSVNRAEAVAVLARALLSAEAIAAVSPSTPFRDVPPGTWFLPYVEIARQHGAIDGPSKAKEFHGERQVILAEFLKILLILDRQNFHAYETEGKPLSRDITDPAAWYYPYLTYGVATTMIAPDAAGNLFPGLLLTRADTAQVLYRYLLWKRGDRVDVAKSTIRTEIELFSLALQKGDSEGAAQNSFRSILLSHRLLQHEPDAALLALQKITWAAGKIVKGERNAAKQLLKEAQELAPELYEEYAPFISTK